MQKIGEIELNLSGLVWKKEQRVMSKVRKKHEEYQYLLLDYLDA